MKWILALAFLAALQVFLLLRVHAELSPPGTFDRVVEPRDSVEGRVRAGAEALFDAVRCEDYGTVVGLLYPPMVEELGGRGAAIRRFQELSASLRASGCEVDGVEVGAVRGPLTAGDELHAVVPFERRVSWIGGADTERSFLVAVSGDGGRSWTYVAGGLVGSERLRELFPSFNDDLVLPAGVRLPEVVRPR